LKIYNISSFQAWTSTRRNVLAQSTYVPLRISNNLTFRCIYSWPGRKVPKLKERFYKLYHHPKEPKENVQDLLYKMAQSAMATSNT
jgi:hypothetical protein